MGQTRHSFTAEKLHVEVFPNRRAMGEAAAKAVSQKMRDLLTDKRELSMLFASAPSQNEFLEALSQSPGLDWKKVTAFHMDEYVGLLSAAPQNFGFFLKKRLFEKVKPARVHYIDGMAKDLQAECNRYAALLENHPFDIACMGIGENGHLAFNDPPVADFDDPRPVKIVDLDLVSREQQVHDGCFKTLDGVPTKAITLTLSTLFRARYIFCMVPAATKAEAVRKALKDPISTACPATILRKHGNAILFLDPDSAKLID